MRHQTFFWDDLMNEMRVVESNGTEMFKDVPADSPYWNEDVLVGEIVEEGEDVQLPEN